MKIVRTIKETIQLNNQQLEFSISFKKGLKNISITINKEGKVRVSAPEKTPSDLIKKLLIEKNHWIQTKVISAKRRLSSTSNKNLKFVTSEKHLFLGKEYTLEVLESTENKVELDDNIIRVFSKRAENELATQLLLKNWYREKAKEIIKQRLEELYRIFSTRVEVPKKLNANFNVKKLKGKWGHCTNKGEIAINEALVLASEKLIEYVIYHELCHLIQHNHSKEFYRLLEKFIPNWKYLRKELKYEKIGL